MYALRTPRHDGGNEVAGGLTATMRAVTSQGFIQFHPSLAERLGFKAALFLGHALYWSRHLAKTQPKRNGWFFMTARQWQQATGLTTREQTSVRELLVDQQLLVERVAGKPARMHFRVDLTRLAHWAGLHADEDGTSLMTWEQFSPWMRGCVSFYRPLVDVAGGSVAAALYLSYLLHAQRFSTQIAGAEDGFFPVSQEDVRIALCLGPKTQRNAREKLRQLGLLHERYGLARIDLDALGQALGQPKGISEAPQARRAASVPSDMATVDTRYQASPGMGVRRRLEPAVTPQPRVKAAAAVSPGRTGSVLLEQMVGQESANRLVIKTRGWLAPSSTLAQSQQEGQSAPPSAACQPSAVLSKLEVALLSKLTCPFVEPIYKNNQIQQLRQRVRARARRTQVSTKRQVVVVGFPRFQNQPGSSLSPSQRPAHPFARQTPHRAISPSCCCPKPCIPSGMTLCARPCCLRRSLCASSCWTNSKASWASPARPSPTHPATCTR